MDRLRIRSGSMWGFGGLRVDRQGVLTPRRLQGAALPISMGRQAILAAAVAPRPRLELRGEPPPGSCSNRGWRAKKSNRPVLRLLLVLSFVLGPRKWSPHCHATNFYIAFWHRGARSRFVLAGLKTRIDMMLSAKVVCFVVVTIPVV